MRAIAVLAVILSGTMAAGLSCAQSLEGPLSNLPPHIARQVEFRDGAGLSLTAFYNDPSLAVIPQKPHISPKVAKDYARWQQHPKVIAFKEQR